jgi:L-ascorbate metabolism protein UlaG (beta-lactamase superfamily)
VADRQPDVRRIPPRHEAIEGATHVLVSHGHADQLTDAADIARELSIPCVGIYDLMSHWEQKHGITDRRLQQGRHGGARRRARDDGERHPFLLLAGGTGRSTPGPRRAS